MTLHNPTEKYALVVLKPDALRQYLDPNILAGIQENGLEIIKRRMLRMSREQVGAFYSEKKEYNYYPLLEDYLTREPSMCLIVKSEQDDATKTAKEYRDWARLNLKRCRYELTGEDMVLLSESKHPLQTEITREMALENLIHVADNFSEVGRCVRGLFFRCDMNDLQRREPRLYNFLMSCPESPRRERDRAFFSKRSCERE